MPVITIFGGIFCRADAVAQAVANAVQYEIVGDRDLIFEASERFNIAENRPSRFLEKKSLK